MPYGDELTPTRASKRPSPSPYEYDFSTLPDPVESAPDVPDFSTLPDQLGGVVDSAYPETKFNIPSDTMGEQKLNLPKWTFAPGEEVKPADEGFSLQTLKDQFTWPNAFRMGASTAGDILGGLAAGPSGGLAYYPISAALGGIGEAGGQLMEGKSPFDLDWKTIGTEAALNPLIPGPNMPGKGAGLRAAGKFALKSAEAGALQAGIGVNPRKWAKEGFFDKEGNFNYAGLDETAGQVGAGFVTGGVVGGALHGATAGYRKYKASPMANGGLYTGEVPSSARQAGNRSTVWDDIDFTQPVNEQKLLGAGPTPEPVVTFPSPDMATIQSYRDRGYVMIPRDPETGAFRMAHESVAGQYNADVNAPFTEQELHGSNDIDLQANVPEQIPYIPDDPAAHNAMWDNLPDPAGPRTAEGQAAAGYGPDLVPDNVVPFTPSTRESPIGPTGSVAQFGPTPEPTGIPPVSEWPVNTTRTDVNTDTPEFLAYQRRQLARLQDMVDNPELKPDGTPRYSLPIRERTRRDLEDKKAEIAAMEARMAATPPTEPNIDNTLGALGVEGIRQPAHNQGDPAWEETPDDAFRGGPVGIVQNPIDELRSQGANIANEAFTQPNLTNQPIQLPETRPNPTGGPPLRSWQLPQAEIEASLNGSEAAAFTQSIQPIGVPEWDAAVARLKEIYSLPKMSVELSNELKDLSHFITRHPQAPPGFRNEYFSKSTDPNKPWTTPPNVTIPDLHTRTRLDAIGSEPPPYPITPGPGTVAQQPGGAEWERMAQDYEETRSPEQIQRDRALMQSIEREITLERIERGEEPPNVPIRGVDPLTQPNLPLNKRTIERAQRRLRDSVPTDTSEPDFSSLPDQQEPLPLSHDIGGPKKFGPGAMVPGENGPDLWSQLENKLGREPTGEEYLRELYNSEQANAPRTIAEQKQRNADIVRTLKENFKTNGDSTDFILPNGDRLTKPMQKIHAMAVSDIGLRLNDVLRAGVVRQHAESSEVNGPITLKQANEIHKIRVERGVGIGYVDVNLPNGDIVAFHHFDSTKPETIRTWVNSHFPNEGMARGDQQLLPGFKESDIRKADIENPAVEIFEGAGQQKLPLESPVLALYREKLPTTKIPREARFLTPEGDMLGFPRGLNTHDDTATTLGTTVDDALQAGLVRVRDGHAEIQSPLTMAQARQLVDMRTYLKNSYTTVDITKPGTYGQHLHSKDFSDRSTPASIYNWVRTMFTAFEKGWNSEKGTKTGSIFGGMPFGKAAAGIKNAAKSAGWGQGISGLQGASRYTKVKNPTTPTPPPTPDYNIIQEALQVPKNAITAGELSAAGRQGLGAITYPSFWRALAKVPGGLTAQGAARIQAHNESNQIYTRPLDANGRELPSLADRMGIHLHSAAGANHATNPRMDHVASRWLEEGIGNSKGQRVWRATGGLYYRLSNRAHRTFIDTLTTDLAESLALKSEIMSGKALAKIQAQGGGTTTIRPGIKKQQVDAQHALDFNPWVNNEYAKELGDFVRTATGQAPPRAYIIPHQSWEINAEKMAGFMNKTMFSTGLFFSRLRATQPATYMMATPAVRKEYMRSALGVAAYWWGLSYAMKMAYGALGYDADISLDRDSSDFGKVRVGNARSDLSGGYQQFLVNYSRMWDGGKSSPSDFAGQAGTWRRFGEGYRAETQGDNLQRFMTNKLEPVSKFAYDLAYADAKNPFHVGDRLAQLVIPLYKQDLYEISKEDKGLLLPMGIASFFGSGTQIYDRNESVGKIIAPENDWLVGGGGGIRALMPWNWDEENGEYQGPGR